MDNIVIISVDKQMIFLLQTCKNLSSKRRLTHLSKRALPKHFKEFKVCRVHLLSIQTTKCVTSNLNLFVWIIIILKQISIERVL